MDFGNSVLTATFPAAVHRVLGTGLARLPKREREGEREREREKGGQRERERESHRFGLWDHQFALPLFVCCFAVSQSHCQHSTAHL